MWDTVPVPYGSQYTRVEARDYNIETDEVFTKEPLLFLYFIDSTWFVNLRSEFWFSKYT